MKAFVRTGSASQEVKLAEVPKPKIQAGEVLIKVAAFGVGIHDRYFIPQQVDFPYVIGSEGAGKIIELGKDIPDFKIDDRVIFTCAMQAQGGSWAEYAVAKQSALTPLPDNLSFAQGASVPIAGKTALECMRELQLEKGDSLFIAGASGAIGTYVIQLAAAKGITVAASASEKNHAYMKSLGLEKAVDYNDADWKNKVKAWAPKGVTAALAIQPNTAQDSMVVVKDGGKLITVSGDSANVEANRGIIVKQMGHQTDKQDFIKLVDAISNGEIRLEIEKEFSFENALDALAKTETRHARGKLIVKVGS